MVTGTTSTIFLGGDDDSRWIDDGMANAAVSPGELLEVAGLETTGADDLELLQPHSTAATNAAVRVAMEYRKGGLGIDDDYATGDYMEYHNFKSGEDAYMWVFAGGNAAGTGTDLSANANIAIGDRLVSYGDGTLRQFDGSADAEGAVLVEATEAVDNSAGTDPARISVTRV